MQKKTMMFWLLRRDKARGAWHIKDGEEGSPYLTPKLCCLLVLPPFQRQEEWQRLHSEGES